MMRDIHDHAGAGASGAMEGSGEEENGAAEVDMDDCGSLALPPDLPPYTGDYIISDYMERLGTRLNILETELKYAWRALDLLSQEYVRMWERLERLESLLADQQGVITTLLDFYTCRSVTARDPLSRLDVIREILGNGTVEDGIEEGLDIGRTCMLVESDEVMESNEEFYKSLNQAYRDDLVCEETSRPGSQLGMIWEAPEENELDILPASSRQIYTATDYKDYCGLQGGPGISDKDLEHISTLSTIDQMTVDKLQELDRLSTQLHKDSRELKDLKSRIISPEVGHDRFPKHDRDIEAKVLVEDGNIINEQLKSVYSGSDNWAINDMIKGFDDFMLGMPKDNMSDKSPSRLSSTESTQTDYLSSALSPRRKFVPERTSTEPYTTVTGRLAYSSAVANAEINAAKALKSPSAISRERFEYNQYQTTEQSRPSFLGTKSTTQTLNDVYKTSNDQQGLLRADMYSECVDSRLQLSFGDNKNRKSPSPPPPAPPNGAALFASLSNNNDLIQQHQSSLLVTSTLPADSIRISPRSPKSPKTSPKHLKRETQNIVAAKSDSGLSSMSGWSSLEKSPGSPKTGKIIHSGYDTYKTRMTSPQLMQKVSYEMDTKPYLETLVDSYAYDSKDKMKQEFYTRKIDTSHSEFKVKETLKSANKIEENYKKGEPSFLAVTQVTLQNCLSDLYYANEAPSIYSVAGNRQPIFTTVYSTPRGILSEDTSFSELLDRNEINESTVRPTVDCFPPEPSYHAQTVIMAPNKKSLMRANTVGSSDQFFHQNSHKVNARNIYAPGSLTDALSYYPTSSRHEPHKQTTLEDQLSWQGSVVRSPTSSMETSSMKSHSLNLTERKQFQNQLQLEYFKQQQYDQRNGNIRYEDQQYIDDSREQAKVRKDQFMGSGTVLVSESGYLSIASNMKSKQHDKMSKKPKRTSSLKSAMSSMSHWLPDLHLPKKHRSHSLPSGVDNVEQQQSEKSLKERLLSAQRRKKKYHLVASMSGLLQKARRKQQSNQSLSDPETSETEWSGGRSSAQSEDSDSVFSDTAHDSGSLFHKIASQPKQRKINNQDIVEQQQKIQEMQQQGIDFPTEEEDTECLVKEKDEQQPFTHALPRDKSDDIDFHFARVSQMKKDSISEIEKLDIDTDISNIDLYEETEKEQDVQSPASLFATIGDVKKTSTTSDEALNDNKSYNGSGPMEFAVSRALGKYRLRKSTSVSDEQVADISHPKSEIENQDLCEVFTSVKDTRIHKTTSPEIISSSIAVEPQTIQEKSPSIQSTRGQNKFQPRHQQSLEIPNKHDDDDSKSTHSWRSGSRVSSRRQSTEDSIDSEDEWYCYELRKLEEMENQSQIESERQNTVLEEPEIEEWLSSEPDHILKEQMSYVLRELKLKTANVKKTYDETPVVDTWKDITTFPVMSETETRKQEQNEEEDKSFDDQSSGETSGPDSPVLSGDDFDDDFESSPVIKPIALEETAPPQEAPAGSKWKLLKALKDKKAEEKISDTPAATTPSTEKDKVSAGVSYLMQKFHEIRVKS